MPVERIAEAILPGAPIGKAPHDDLAVSHAGRQNAQVVKRTTEKRPSQERASACVHQRVCVSMSATLVVLCVLMTNPICL